MTITEKQYVELTDKIDEILAHVRDYANHRLNVNERLNELERWKTTHENYHAGLLVGMVPNTGNGSDPDHGG
jgi:hypothetical protein